MPNIDPTTVNGLIILAVYAVANLVGKTIPDSATGLLAYIRKGAKILGLYVSNKA